MIISGRVARGTSRQHGPVQINRERPQALGLAAWWPLAGHHRFVYDFISGGRLISLAGFTAPTGNAYFSSNPMMGLGLNIGAGQSPQASVPDGPLKPSVYGSTG